MAHVISRPLEAVCEPEMQPQRTVPALWYFKYYTNERVKLFVGGADYCDGNREV